MSRYQRRWDFSQRNCHGKHQSFSTWAETAGHPGGQIFVLQSLENPHSVSLMGTTNYRGKEVAGAFLGWMKPALSSTPWENWAKLLQAKEPLGTQES